ncbi:unnamed protein product [Candida verbasci]|uniref:tRNA pseudouridine(55) synthase n=1 Tax=Candida verbasci TaxID=1227364 RepID=A0A9W4TX26_9ASCO|nr:unnamed protein product [Candida verbasci]
MNGIFAVNKPSGITSAKFIDELQSIFTNSSAFANDLKLMKEKIEYDMSRDKKISKKRMQQKIRNCKVKIGHGGTLDPLASGVLVIGIGSGTKKLQHYLTGCEKTYETKALLGISTTTGDSEGEIIYKTKIDHINDELVEKTVLKFMGKIKQTPPIFSALKVNGKPLYEYARQGLPLPTEGIKVREVTINDIKILDPITLNHDFKKLESIIDEETGLPKEHGLINNPTLNDSPLYLNEEYKDEKIEKPKITEDLPDKLPLIHLKSDVSSGTYIRSLISDIEKLMRLINRQFKRFFINTSSKSTLSNARSIINSIDFKLITPNFQPKSVLIFSTPSNLPQIIQDSIKLQEKNIQVIVAGVDAVLNNRNGISELWLDEKIKIQESIKLEERDNINEEPKESDGINIVTARKNWINIKSQLSIDLNYHHNIICLNLANTVFTTGKITTLYYFDNDYENSGLHLCDLKIQLPKGLIKHPKVIIEDQWEPLYEEKFTITNCVGNLVKTLNDKPASKYLENNEKLNALASKDTEIYVKIDGKKRFKVTAGGGGWGVKANMIALSNEAQLQKGHTLEFFMVPPNLTYKHKQFNYHDCITFSSCPIEINYATGSDMTTKVYENVFGCGCEGGFFFNEIKHNSPSETIFIKI